MKTSRKSVIATAVLGLSVLLTACVSTRIEESRRAVTLMETDDAVVILGRAKHTDDETEASFTECVNNALAGRNSRLSLVSESEFVDAMFPFFEPRLAPNNLDDLSRVLNDPLVAGKVNETRVRYLVWLDGNTETTDQGGSMTCTIGAAGGGCFGLNWWERDSSYEATIWDMKNLNAAGYISADSKGTSYVAGLILPIPMIARTGKAACEGLAEQLGEFLAMPGDGSAASDAG
ncbi:MAG: hypothetical protein HKN59_02835 [Gammaproteobacteria bacterium]|nr:hypothetical protein [Gammaproteobacteria bacterium]